MHTYIYMVRHGESPKGENERTRGLTEKGKLDSCRITELLHGEGIGVFVSSPYQRAILTIEELAQRSGQKVIIFEDLKERIFINGNKRISDEELLPLLNKSYSNPDFALPGGESNSSCQNRAIKVLNKLLEENKGQKIALGTHGAVMALMMEYYDSKYDLNFLLSTSKPDVYKMEFNGQTLIDVTRLWST
ncbi:histidine phosphatase family protein [Cytobacillus sp. Hm23]